MNYSRRPATFADLAAINEIYNHYVASSTATYQTEPSTLSERQAWFAAHGGKHPVLVAEAEGKIVGWGSLSPFHPRAAYGQTVENSVYLREGWHGKGIGSALLGDLIRLGREAGHHVIVAMISADQAPSIALHKKFGFRDAGKLEQVGRKFERWLDVVYLQLKL